MATEKRLIDLTGQRFGKLVVISRESKYNRNATWRCLCDCGKETVVRGDVLKRGTTQSCGCGKGLKHGYFYEPWYPSYKAMMERCYLPSSGNYERYGGKGVTVCEEWHDINNFAEWVETSGYEPGLTIDRINPLGNYEPSNCQWLTRSENSKKQFEDRKVRAKDMVEVVRCKDCKNYFYSSVSMGMRCRLDGTEWGKDDFCSCGERKDMDKLKPCPLCKCGNIYEIEREDLYIGHYPQIFCNGCKMIFEIENNSPYLNDATTYTYLREKLLNAWNNRANAKPAEIDFDYEAED